MDYSQFGRADWAALKGAGLTQPYSNGKGQYLDSTAASNRLASFLQEHATVSTDDEFEANGVSMSSFIQNAFGLPISTSDEVVEELEAFINARLAGKSTGDVQGVFTSGWMIKGRFLRTVTDVVDGTVNKINKTLWAFTQERDLVVKYASLPGHKRVLSYEGGNLRDSIAQARKVPGIGPELVAMQQHRVELVQLASNTAYAKVTAGMSASELEAFKVEVDSRLEILRTDTDLVKKRLAIEAA